ARADCVRQPRAAYPANSRRRRTPRGRSPCRRRRGGRAVCPQLQKCVRSYGCFHDGSNDFVVTGAAAQIAGQPEPGLVFCRFRFFVEQRFRRDDESWCADPALQRGVLEERFLERMQDVVLRDPFDRRDGPSLCFRREHEARRHQATVEQDRAGATVTRRAAFFGARQTERVAQRRQQRLMTVAQEFGRLTVDGRVDVQLHRIRPAAIFAARFVRTPATVRRYATVPRLSSIGLAAALAAAAAAFSARSSSFDPMSAFAASGTSNAVGATAPMATRAAVQTPFASSVTLTPAPAT